MLFKNILFIQTILLCLKSLNIKKILYNNCAIFETSYRYFFFFCFNDCCLKITGIIFIINGYINDIAKLIKVFLMRYICVFS